MHSLFFEKRFISATLVLGSLDLVGVLLRVWSSVSDIFRWVVTVIGAL